MLRLSKTTFLWVLRSSPIINRGMLHSLAGRIFTNHPVKFLACRRGSRKWNFASQNATYFNAYMHSCPFKWRNKFSRSSSIKRHGLSYPQPSRGGCYEKLPLVCTYVTHMELAGSNFPSRRVINPIMLLITGRYLYGGSTSRIALALSPRSAHLITDTDHRGDVGREFIAN